MKLRLKDIIEKIQDTYWSIIPYSYRPHNMWYVFKCWSWKRHTTIKPRYLPHTWVDKVEVLPHMMFEILSQFIEKECSPGMVEWYGETPHMVVVNGEKTNVRDEMQALYDWWHKICNKDYTEVSEILWKEHEKLNIETYHWNDKEEQTPDEVLACDILRAQTKLEHMQNKDIAEKMHRLVNITQYLWT